MDEFERIYRVYFQDVYRFVRRLSGDEATAEEITSETFFKAMQAIDRFRGESDLRVWLCQIAKNLYYTELRKRGRLTALDDPQALAQPAPEASPEERAADAADAAQIERLVRALPDPYREVFQLRVFAELPFERIGAMYGKSANWACVTYHRARQKIRTKLEGNAGESRL